MLKCLVSVFPLAQGFLCHKLKCHTNSVCDQLRNMYMGFDVGEAVKSVFVCCSQCPCAITVFVSGFIWLFFVPKLSPSLLHGSSGDILMCRNDL